MKIILTKEQAYNIYHQVEVNNHNRTSNPYVIETDDQLNGLLDKMKDYKQRKDNEEYWAKVNRQKAEDEAYRNICGLKDRIQKILKVGNACIEYDIPIWKDTHNLTKALYENGCFETDGIYHQLGFINLHNKYGDPKPTEYKYIGFRMGGDCGYLDFWTNGIETWDVNESNREDKRIASLEHMEKFLAKFDEFEREFYKYIESVTK